MKPRFNSMAESVSDFKRVFNGMNKFQPREAMLGIAQGGGALNEHAAPVYQSNVDLRYLMDTASYLDEASITKTLQEATFLEQQLADIYGKLGMLGLSQLNAVDRHAIAGRHETIIDKLQFVEGRLNEAHRKADSTMAVHLKERLGATGRWRKAQQTMHERIRGPRGGEVTESKGESLGRFRILAGMDYEEMMPRDPGMSGTNRFASAYELPTTTEAVRRAGSGHLTEERGKIQQAALALHEGITSKQREAGQRATAAQSPGQNAKSVAGKGLDKIRGMISKNDPLATRAGKGGAKATRGGMRDDPGFALSNAGGKQKPNLPESSASRMRGALSALREGRRRR